MLRRMPLRTYLTEIRAASATFLTMAYILFVNPLILVNAITVPHASGQLLTATALAAAFGSIVMGTLARLPFALAPGMGLNAFFTYTVVLSMGIPWQTALGAVFVAGLLFIVISLSGLRAIIVNAIPHGLKQAMGAGIGLFLALIGLQSAGLIAAHKVTLITAGNLHEPAAILSLGGLFLAAALLHRRVTGALILAIIAVSTVAIVSGADVYQGKNFSGFAEGLMAAPVWPTDLFLAMDLKGVFSLRLLPVVLMFLFVNFFDTAGTLFGLASRGGFLDSKGHLPRARMAFTADALATTFSAVVGVSPTTAYIESAAGISEGGRTGLTAILVGLLFLGSIFFWPLAQAVPTAATAPVLIIIGCLMMAEVSRIAWHRLDEGIPAFLTIIGIPFSYSIANGVSFGIISYVIIALLTGQARKLNVTLIVLASLLLCRYLFIGVGDA